MMKAFGLAATLLAVANTPLQAQEAPLSEDRKEFLAELMAMGAACSELDYVVRFERMGEWVTQQLSTQPESVIEEILNLSDSKVEEMQAEAQRLRDMRRGNVRDRAVEEHYARSVERCDRMATHEQGGDFIVRR